MCASRAHGLVTDGQRDGHAADVPTRRPAVSVIRGRPRSVSASGSRQDYTTTTTVQQQPLRSTDERGVPSDRNDRTSHVNRMTRTMPTRKRRRLVAYADTIIDVVVARDNPPLLRSNAISYEIACFFSVRCENPTKQKTLVFTFFLPTTVVGDISRRRAIFYTAIATRCCVVRWRRPSSLKTVGQHTILNSCDEISDDVEIIYVILYCTLVREKNLNSVCSLHAGKCVCSLIEKYKDDYSVCVLYVCET